MTGPLQNLDNIEEVTNLKDNNGVYAVRRTGPFKDYKSAQDYLDKQEV